MQALTRYYETLREEELIAPRYYSKASVSYGLQLDTNGNLIGLLRLKQTVERNGKEFERPQSLDVPELAVRSSGVLPNFLCDNAIYMLGLDAKGDAKRALRCFESAKDLHLS
ncbi:MAG: type I-C CRISPR-associated protein Cas8c/Csd1, partial [Eubacteriales bacterium]|nr:type I-C CRISPR-associated protein Cas8c/Csd1 [Eubacteriales bacterium]